MSGVFQLARMQELPLWALPALASQPCFAHNGPPFAPFMNEFLAQIEPGNDAFLTEKYAAELDQILAGWSEILCRPVRDLNPLGAMLSTSLTASALDKPQIRKLRAGPPLETEEVRFLETHTFHRDELLRSLHQYLAAFHVLRVAGLQIASVEVLTESPLRLRTAIDYDLLGDHDASRAEERTGRWNLSWIRTDPARWFITGWEAGVETRSRLIGKGFVDVSTSWLGQIPSFRQQLQHGSDYWRTTLDGACGIDVYGNNGIAAGDFDGDGFDDIYICQPAGLPNRLYRNRGDGSFEDVTDQAGVGVLDATSSALFGDFTNNGLQDLIVVRTDGPIFFRNRGDGTFEYRKDAFHFARPPQGSFTAAASVDYDRDGLLDVYFCLYSYYQGLSAYRFPSPYYDAQNGPPNFLFKNRGDGTFEDVTVSSGMDHNNNRYSFACSWNDYDNDGWPDLYVANDFGRKNLYHNNGDGTFTDVSAEAGVEDPGAGMSVCWFDYDNDGFDDLYVANMWSFAGQRVTEQQVFLPSADQAIRRIYRQHASGNALFHNEKGSVSFRDTTEQSGAAMGRWSWSSDAWDVDHDGYPDLYVTNGFLSGPRKDNLSSFFWRQVVSRSLAAGGNSTDYEESWNAINELIRSDYSWSGQQRNNFYLNDRNGHFSEAAGVLGLDLIDDSRSFVLADIDHDGRLEVILKNRTAPQLRILRNQMSPLGSSISFSLKGTRSNRDAIGAVVEVETQQGLQRNTLRSGSGFLAQHSKVLSFGLGKGEEAVRATVHWPSGAKQVFEDLPRGHRIEIEEGSETIGKKPFQIGTELPVLGAGAAADDLSGSFETWLVEPMAAPAFKLPDTAGIPDAFTEKVGQPILLVFFTEDCAASRAQLNGIAVLWQKFRDSGLNVLALRTNSQGESSLPFPVMTADADTRQIYSILYRFLFDRRREMSMPTSFLLDREHQVIKIYSGSVDAAHILADWQTAPATSADRLRLALPFPGHYFGEALHHNDFSYGVAFLRYGFPGQATAFFERAIARNPSFAGSYYNLGLIYIGQKRFDEACANLGTAVKLDPANANAWNNLGVAYGQQGQYSRALVNFEKAIALRPSQLNAIQNAVVLLRLQHRLPDARVIVEKAIAVEPDSTELHQVMGRILLESGDASGARAEFERAVQIAPANAEARNGLGLVLMHLGDDAGAKQQFEQCQKLAPAYDGPYLNLALLYARAGDVKQAHDILAGYLRNQPDNAQVRRAMAQLDGRR